MYKILFIQDYTTPAYKEAIESLIEFLMVGDALHVMGIYNGGDNEKAYLLKCHSEKSSNMIDQLSGADAISSIGYDTKEAATEYLETIGYSTNDADSPLAARIAAILKKRQISAPVTKVIRLLPDNANALDDEALDACITAATVAI